MFSAVSFSTPSEKSNKAFNNADSFAMAFDSAWKTAELEKTNLELKPEQKLDLVLEQLRTHPFVIDSPSRAKQVAEFRIRLLKLNN